MNKENEILKIRLCALQSDIILYKKIMKDKDKQIKNLSTRLKRANLELKELKKSKVVELTIFDMI